MNNKTEFKVTIKKEDNVYKAWLEDQPHVRALSYTLDIVKLNIKECIEVWCNVENPKIIFTIKEQNK